MREVNYTPPSSSSVFRLGLWLLGGLAAIYLVFSSWYIVDQGERAVVLRLGATVGEAGPGPHFKAPWVDSVRKITVQKNVVLKNDNGERLDGPELIWDEKTKEIYTDRFVKITRADGSIVYSYGFKSNEGFTRYELNAVSGDMNVEEVSGKPAYSLHQVPPKVQAKPTPIKPAPVTIQDRKDKVKGEL